MTIKFSDITGGGIPYGNNAGRPQNPGIGKLYSNGEMQRLELYTGAQYGWQNIVAETPGVTGYTGTVAETNLTNTINVLGTNFSNGATVTLVGNDGTEVVANSVTVNNLTSLTAVFGPISPSKEPYDIRVTNPSNLYGVYYDILSVNNQLTWQTAAGSLGTFNEQVSVSVSATATDPDSTVSYSLANGSSLPNGLTLNSSTGQISGTLPSVSATTIYNFTINASDGVNPAVPRTFSLTSNNTIDVEYLLVAGGGAGGQAYAAGGGAGGLLSGSKKLLKSQSYTVTIGLGGVAAAADTGSRGGNGQNSIFDNLTSIGGGGGGSYGNTQATGSTGGSGGGSAREDGGSGASGTPGQGNSGGAMSSNSSGSVYRGGGGGGAGGAGYAGDNQGSFNGDGGIGIQSSITGVSTYYAGGGGGGVYNNTSDGGPAGDGGLGGGGNGLKGAGTAQSGSANTGGGGGGGGGIGTGSNGGMKGGDGGSGILVIAYPNTEPDLTIGQGLTYTLDNSTRSGYKVYKFTAGSGTLSFNN